MLGFFFNKYIAHPCLYRTSIKSNDFKQVSKLSSDICIYLLSEANEIHYKKENFYIVPLLYYINFQVQNLKILICNFKKNCMCNGTKNNTKSEDIWKAIDRMSRLILLPALHETDPNMVNNTVKGKIYSPESSDGEEDLPR